MWWEEWERREGGLVECQFELNNTKALGGFVMYWG